jgi:hypothetical protein
MTLRRWVVFDGGQPQCKVDVTLGPGRDATMGWKVRVKTLHKGLSDGVVAVEVDNGAFRFVILPTRGMSLWRGWIDGRYVGWNSWVQGPVHPQHVPLDEPSGRGWLAGFDELLVRCGLASNGPPVFGERGELVHPQHGKVANLMARNVEVTFNESCAEIAVHGIVEERHGDCWLELHATYRTRLGQPGVTIHDEIYNLAESPVSTQLLYHVNLGPPLLEEGSCVVAPVKTLVPREKYESRCATNWSAFWSNPEAEEEVYFSELAADRRHQTGVLLRNAVGDFGVSLSFNVRLLPCFTLWKMMGAGDGGQVTGLEPGTNFPNRRSFEAAHGRTRVLDPGEHAAFDLGMSLHLGNDAVELVTAEILQLQSTSPSRVFAEPQTGWSPDC